jgi:hypothetical protein
MLRQLHQREWLAMISCLIMATIVSACAGGELRGHSIASPDGKTYLVVDDDNGGECGGLRVDGKTWSYKIHSEGPITAGTHKIECGTSGTRSFEVRQGTTFHFNYWGP